MDRAKTLICEALDADTIGLKEVKKTPPILALFTCFISSLLSISWP